jgi:hypothetical protein
MRGRSSSIPRRRTCLVGEIDAKHRSDIMVRHAAMLTSVKKTSGGLPPSSTRSRPDIHSGIKRHGHRRDHKTTVRRQTGSGIRPV